MTSDLRELVKAERRRRGLSIRAAAILGEISNTAWSEWESGKRAELGVVQQAVSKAFGWPETWPSDPPTPPAVDQNTVTMLLAVLARLEELVARLEQLLDPPAAPAAPPEPPKRRQPGPRSPSRRR